MEVAELIQKVFGKPVAPTPVQAGMADTFAGVVPVVKQKKNDVFSPAILSKAQQTFAAPAADGGGEPKNSPSSGTAGSMIPPGWSSQKK